MVFAVATALPVLAVTVSGDELVKNLIEEILWADSDVLNFTETDLFVDESGEFYELEPSEGWQPVGASLITWETSETSVGPSELVPPGSFSSDPLFYSGVETSNDLPTDEFRLLAVQTDSMRNGCQGLRREVAVSMARPGLPIFESNDVFVGNPGIGNNVQLSFALNNCVPEAFYLEVVDGQYQSFQSRGGIQYKDDGEVATVIFTGAPPTFDGPVTVTAAQSETNFDFTTTYGWTTLRADWPATVPIPDLETITIEDLAATSFQLIQVDTAGDPTPPVSQDDPTTPQPTTEGGFPWIPVVAGGTLAGLAAWFGFKAVGRKEGDGPRTAAQEIDEYMSTEEEQDLLSRSGALQTRSMVEGALRRGAPSSASGYVPIDFLSVDDSLGHMSEPVHPDQYIGIFINQYTLETVRRGEAEWNRLVEETGVEPGTDPESRPTPDDHDYDG